MGIVSKIYTLCNEKRYFTCGSSSSYDRMFDLARQVKEEGTSTPRDVAVAIWVCSDNKDLSVITQEVEDIYNSESRCEGE